MLKQLAQTLTGQKQIAEVVTANADGTVTVRQGNGEEWRVIGSASAGAKVYVKDGAVIGTAPSLDSIVLEV